jgi:Pre ATP-grasp domain/PGM1 C-terminal domain
VRKLVVGNVDAETMVAGSSRLPYASKCGSAGAAQRLSWALQDGDVLVSPTPPSDDLLDYVSGFTGLCPASVSIVTPPQVPDDITLISSDQLTTELLPDIKNALSAAPEWELFPYYFDRSLAWLARHLGLHVDPALLEFCLEGGSEDLNTKSSFRRIAASTGLPVPEGAVCSTGRQVLLAVQDLVGVTGELIVKQDVSASGGGNVVLTDSARTESVGARETLGFRSRRDLLEAASALWDRLTGPENRVLVVEAYHENTSSPYAEFRIPPDGRAPRLTDHGDQRMEPLWVGFEIPPATLAAHQMAHLVSGATVAAGVARDRGYRGPINVDAIRTLDGRILFTEVNARIGGPTHIHALAERLLGPGYEDRNVVLTRNRVPAPPFRRALALLDAAGLLFLPGRGEGILLLIDDWARRGVTETMTVAPDRDRALRIEQEALRILREARP